MILVRNIKIPIKNNGDIFSYFYNRTNLYKNDISDIKIYKKSLDARDKNNLLYNYSFLIKTSNDNKILKQLKKFDSVKFVEKEYIYKKAYSEKRPIIIGFGPAGMFCSYVLAKAGLKPIIYERGKDVDSRKSDVENFFSGKPLNENSNIQFGEGGAGTFSDGKLNTGINDYRIREVLKILNHFGADDDILYESKPHIGTDVLIKVVKNIREEIIRLGGEIYFEHKLDDVIIKNNKISGVLIKNTFESFIKECEYLILAPGHSARDTFKMLKSKNIEMTPKDFAVGVRIEHKQNSINKAQYGEKYSKYNLPAADYKLSCHLDNGRGVFTFCMCPGGVVVNASSENNGVVTNGMSNKSRNGTNANSAVLVGVKVEDFYIDDVLDGVEFQRKIEQKAFEVGKGFPICQRFEDFKNGLNTVEFGEVKPSIRPTIAKAEINEIFPKYITQSLVEGIEKFGDKLDGFSDPDAILTAPETRSSSPVRIIRNEDGMSSVFGFFPCGEGAGYAGGIMSAAVDGMKSAEKLISEISNYKKQ